MFTPVGLANPALGQHAARHAIVAQAKWASGSKFSSVTPAIAAALGLPKAAAAEVWHPAGTALRTAYRLRVYFNPHDFVDIEAVEMEAPFDYGLIIGIDIIYQGDFFLTHHEGQTLLRFRIPSQGTHDF